ncbi:MAG: thiamine pyrophosphate-dependent enzyme [Candidatus Caldatribacteriota bacterium]|nr:thiamine pyrophosphate-dependent enzyme [Candidatus Caldatribacteriota bacterium]
MKKLLTGNEAVAEGIIESGVEVVCGYPGTPSTEVILTLLSQKEELGIHIEWSTNEKVAFEIASAAAWAGKRALVTMKMSGVNVAADSLASIAYSGCTGGLVIFVADDPGVSAGMPEEDSRYYAKSMVVPMLDLASQQECLDYVKVAFEISEKIGGPVFLRSTTDISHVASDVEIGKKLKLEKREAHFERDIAKYTKAGAVWCMAQHRDALGRLAEASKICDSCITESGIKVNETHFENGSKQGVIYAGAVEGNFKEALKKYNLKLSWLKIGMVHPLPEERIKEFLEKVDRVLILEELDPLVEAEVIRVAYLLNKRVEILGKFDKTLSLIGNYSFKKIKNALEVLLKTKLESGQDSKILERAKELEVKRPTSFCIGCPHRGTYFALNKAIKNLKYKKDEIIITGDIGCTILGMSKPFESCWTEVAMGASIGLAQGFKWAGIKKPVIATIGDSTFFHAGIPPLVNAVYHKVPITVIILDNGWTAMTGFEENPGTINLNGATDTKRVDIVEICQGCGIKDIQIIDPYQSEKATDVIAKAIEYPGVSVIVSRRECALQVKRRKVKFPQRKVNIDKCTGCRICLSSLACPAMVFHPKDAHSKAYMEITSACFGCGLCEFTCPTGAIEVIKNGK